MTLSNNQLLEYINSKRKSVDEWTDLRIYFEDTSVYHLQLYQDIMEFTRPKSMILKKGEVISYLRELKLKQLGI